MIERNKGILLMVLSSLAFACMAAAVKFVSHIPTMEIVFFRNVIGLLVATYLILKSGQPFTGNNKKLLLYRSIFGLLGVFLYFYTISQIPLANAVVLQQTNPFFLIILSFIFLKEQVNKLQVTAILTALVGVVLVTQPGLDYRLLPSITGILAAVTAATAYTTIRHLRLTDHPKVIVFYFTAFSSIAAIPFMLAGQFVMPSIIDLIALISVGLFATAGQFLMTHSYRYAEAADLSIYSYGKTIFSIFIGILLWVEIPDMLSIIGVVFILAGAYINYRSKL